MVACGFLLRTRHKTLSTCRFFCTVSRQRARVRGLKSVYPRILTRDAVIAPIIELRGAGRRMGRHLARFLERAAVLEVGRDPGTPEGAVAHLRGDAGRLGSPPHHLPGVDAVEPFPLPSF